MIQTMTLEEQELLLGRQVEPLLTPEDRRQFAGRVCVITGAGGTVGAELARQLAECAPARLVLIEQSEYGLFRIEDHLRETYPHVPIDVVLCDVTRGRSVRRVFRRVRPDIVFHAAAYKHVTMAERAICATARVNVLGTRAVLLAAEEVGARLVLISTDKAAAPRSVMGATKRLAELVALDRVHGASRPIVVRFGNVLASSGSFVESMRERIDAGLPLIVTDPNATRFFMTVAEAASLVMKATTLANGGETFWLDMGHQVRVGDLAERMLLAAAQRGVPPVPIEIIGLRPGEKMNEQLASQGLRLDRTSNPRVWVAQQAPVARALATSWIDSIRRAIRRDDAHAVLTTLTASVRDFVPSEQAWETARIDPAGPVDAAQTSAFVEVARSQVRPSRVATGVFPRPVPAIAQRVPAAVGNVVPLRPRARRAR
jgi:FlaA1/EpsC-like NDP-sugar epimerase